MAQHRQSTHRRGVLLPGGEAGEHGETIQQPDEGHGERVIAFCLQLAGEAFGVDPASPARRTTRSASVGSEGNRSPIRPWSAKATRVCSGIVSTVSCATSAVT
jgi:hypothetical protein